VEGDVSDAERIAHAFVEARRAGHGLARYPGTAPTTLGAAYRIQDAAIAAAGEPVVGWKVGKIAPPVDGSERLAGPIFAPHVVAAGDRLAAMPVFADGFAAAEAEFLLRIDTAPEPGRIDWTNADARALVGAVHVGIEIASSPYPRINADGPAVTVSDFGNNNGLVVGRAIDDWRDIDLDTCPVALLINGEQIGAATTATMLDGPFGAVRFLLEHAARRGIALTPGTWISTGAVTGVHPVAAGDLVEARFGTGYTVHCAITAR